MFKGYKSKSQAERGGSKKIREPEPMTVEKIGLETNENRKGV